MVTASNYVWLQPQSPAVTQYEVINRGGKAVTGLPTLVEHTLSLSAHRSVQHCNHVYAGCSRYVSRLQPYVSGTPAAASSSRGGGAARPKGHGSQPAMRPPAATERGPPACSELPSGPKRSQRGALWCPHGIDDPTAFWPPGDAPSLSCSGATGSQRPRLDMGRRVAHTLVRGSWTCCII